jgi:hypothetical protein
MSQGGKKERKKEGRLLPRRDTAGKKKNVRKEEGKQGRTEDGMPGMVPS